MGLGKFLRRPPQGHWSQDGAPGWESWGPERHLDPLQTLPGPAVVTEHRAHVTPGSMGPGIPPFPSFP